MIALRNAELEDAEELYELIVENREHLTNLEWTQSATLLSTRKFIASINASNEVFRLIYFNGQLAGVITLRPSVDFWLLGYWLGNEFRGQGITYMALKLLLIIHHAMGHREPIRARVRYGNTASRRIIQKAGFRLLALDGEWGTYVLESTDIIYEELT